MKYTWEFVGLILSIISELFLIRFVQKWSKTRKSLTTSFQFAIACTALWCACLAAQILFINFSPDFDYSKIDYFTYIPVCLTPVAIFFIQYYFSHGENPFRKSFLLLFIVPIITYIVVFTNDSTHWFYEHYSIYSADTTFGPYFPIYIIYTYGLLVIDVILLIRASMRNLGSFTKQTILIVVGTLFPLLINVFGMFYSLSVYITPMSFIFSMIFWAIGIFKYNFLEVNPIALNIIVNQMSDLYFVLTRDYLVSDCNAPTEKVFNYVKTNIIGKSLEDIEFYDRININENAFKQYLSDATSTHKTYRITAKTPNKDKFFNIEISGVYNTNKCIGILVLIKDITQHTIDMETLKDNQNMLLERERLASLGQMIGGIAHNLKTPIMSISGAADGINDLITEYEKSVGDKDVTVADHHAIAKDMRDWVTKIKEYDSYMSDIITAVKGQSVNMNSDMDETFTISDLLSRVKILMKHELKQAMCALNIKLEIPEEQRMIGNVNSLVQVVDNLISNAIQSYGKVEEVKKDATISSLSKNIDLTIKKNKKNIIIEVKDYGAGIPKEIQGKLFKEMITTKGHNGSGLGLFMSYSTIRGNFSGNLTFESEEKKGTTFTITLPSYFED